MPTYEYQCTACEERLEVEQRFTDDPLTECPKCGGELRKVYSPVGVVFKGSGFYKTDSRSSSTSSAKESGATSPKESTSSSDASSTSSSPAAPAPASTPSTPASSASSSDS